MSKDLHHIIDTHEAFPITAFTSDTTIYGDPIDQRGYESFELSVVSGILVDGTYTITVEESDDITFVSGVTEITGDRLLGDYANMVFSTGENNTVKRIGFIVKNRYFRAKVVSSSVTSGGSLSGQAILGDPANAPTTGAFAPLA